jgi:hypothetical protein
VRRETGGALRVARAPDGLAFRPAGRDASSDWPRVRGAGAVVPVGAETVHLDRTKLVDPAPLLGPGGRPLALERGVLVVSVDFDGIGNAAILSHVTPPARVVWSRSTRDVVGPNDLGKNAGYRLVFAAVRGPTVLVVAEAETWRRPDGGSHEVGTHVARIAEIDPATGLVRASHPLAPPE